MMPRERAVIISLLKIVGARDVLEIGVQEGWCAVTILAHIPNIRTYTGVDVMSGYKPGLPQQLSERPDKPGCRVNDPRFTLVLHPRGSLDMQADGQKYDA